MRVLFSLFCLTTILQFGLCQTGIIRGTVIDDATGEALIGATAVIANTTTGGITDLDGQFSITNLQPSIYTIQVSYVSYETQFIQNIEVLPNEISTVNIRLKEASIGLDEVVVQATALKSAESALLTIQKKAPNVLDGISAEQFGRSGDNDAASAIKRVTGVSVEGGKYVYVRGLGDRYSKTTLNGADIPGLDPEKNTVQMDLFPSNLIDNILVYKTFTPDLPGNFSGGYVDIATKDFPDAFTFQLSTSFGYNPQANLNDQFLTYNTGKLDWLGIDDGTRSLPESIDQGVPGRYKSTEDNKRLTAITKSFNNDLAPINKSKFLNQSHAVSVGNQHTLFGKPVGYHASISYRRNFESYQNGEIGRYSLQGSSDHTDVLNTELYLDDQQSIEEVIWGAMLGTSIKLTPYQKISLNILRNQSGKSTARNQIGYKPSDNVDLGYQTRTLLYLQRAFTSAQLKGDHALLHGKGIRVDWILSVAKSDLSEPDLRFFTNGIEVVGEETTYRIEPSIGQIPTRFSRTMAENNIDSKINITVPVNFGNGGPSSLKFGGAYVIKNREFRELQYGYANETNTFSGVPAEYVADDNVWNYEENNSPYGVYLVDSYQPRNNYDASERVGAAYAMANVSVSDRFKVISGLRAEKTNILTESFNEDLPKGILDNLDFLPSLNLNYELINNMNLRAAYGRTIARPTFRELAPFGSFNFVGDYTLVGNDSLRRSIINNVDLRWEYFNKPGEIISISGFYKHFQDAIQKVINPVAANPEFNFQNALVGHVLGVELEWRKSLSVLGSGFQPFFLGSNVSLIKSIVSIDAVELESIRATDPNAADTRPMFGQSPFIVNAYLRYQNEKGTTAQLTYNVQGPRLAAIAPGGTPDIYEQPRNMLGFSINQQFGKWKLSFNANNLLNAEQQFTQTFKERIYYFSRYAPGRSFSLGVNFLIE